MSLRRTLSAEMTVTHDGSSTPGASAIPDGNAALCVSTLSADASNKNDDSQYTDTPGVLEEGVVDLVAVDEAVPVEVDVFVVVPVVADVVPLCL